MTLTRASSRLHVAARLATRKCRPEMRVHCGFEYTLRMIYTRSRVARTGCKLLAQMRREDLIFQAWSLIGSFPGVRFASFNYRSSSSVAYSFFFLPCNSARGRTSETPIYPSSMENMSDVTKRMVSTWVPCAILGLFIQNESCPIKRDASCALHLFIMRHVSSIFRL